jgi:RimJ/RimL family protein N-acetyltransferase
VVDWVHECLPTLVTDRLILRPFTESDLDAYFELMTTPEVRSSLRLPETFAPVTAWTGMAMWLGQWELRGSGYWALEERTGGRMVGRVGLHRPPWPDWPGLEVRWTLHPECWGLGYATEAGARAIDFAFEVLGADEVVSVILPENQRSQKVARRLGFELADERILSFSPDLTHGIWKLARPLWGQGVDPPGTTET